MIQKVSYDASEKVIEDFSMFDAWAIQLRVVGKTHKHVQIYFQVLTLVSWTELIQK